MKHILSIFLFVTALAQGQQSVISDKPISSKDPVARTVRILVVGTRPMPVFEKRGGVDVEVDPPLRVLCPSMVEFGDEPPKDKAEKPEDVLKRQRGVPIGRVVKVENYKGPDQFRIKLLRPSYGQSHTPPVVTCSLGGMLEPLIVISAEDGSRGWENPQIKLMDLSPQKVPARSVLAVNLTKAPLAVFFESAQAPLDPHSMRLIPLPEHSSDMYRFCVEAKTSQAPISLVKSVYQQEQGKRLILVAMPVLQPSQGMPPINLQMVLDTTTGG